MTRTWAADPEVDDAAVRSATGRGWDEWCDIIDAWPGSAEGHTAVARHLADTYDEVTDWWAQGITVGWERITGRRLRGQMSDGTFSANKSKTLLTDATGLRAMLLDDAARPDLFPGVDTELRSAPSAKAIRIAVGPGVAQLSVEDKGDGRAKISIQHNKLPEASDVATWKSYWTAWLDTIDQD